MDAHISDDELLAGTRAGDEGAFIALYNRRQGEIFRFVLRMSRSEHLAEDVTQEVFMSVLNQKGNYEIGKGQFRAYLYAIARNKTLTHLNKDKAHISIDDEVNGLPKDWMDEMVVVDHPLDGLTRNESIEAVKQAISVLPLIYREVIVLCDLNEVSYMDAAQILDCSIGTIRSRLHRARAILLDRMGTGHKSKVKVKL